MKRFGIITLLLLVVLLVVPVLAQGGDDDNDDSETTIEFSGIVEIIDDTTISVGGLIVDISGLDEAVVATLEDGMTIVISGNIDGDVVIAVSVDDGSDDDAEPEATETPDSEDDSNDDADNQDDDGEDDDVSVTIVLEGPVDEIDGATVTIYGFVVQLDDTDPRLVVIQIGDTLRIEGNFGDSEDGTIIIIALFFEVTNIEIYIFDGEVWRDPENCQNPPPPWAPANGWHARCDTPSGGDGGSRGRGGSNKGGS